MAKTAKALVDPKEAVQPNAPGLAGRGGGVEKVAPDNVANQQAGENDGGDTTVASSSHYWLIAFVVILLAAIVYLPMLVLLLRILMGHLGTDVGDNIKSYQVAALMLKNGDIDSISTVLQTLVAAIASYRWREFAPWAFYTLCGVLLLFVMISYVFSSLALDPQLLGHADQMIDDTTINRAVTLYKSTLFLLTTLLGVRAATSTSSKAD